MFTLKAMGGAGTPREAERTTPVGATFYRSDPVSENRLRPSKSDTTKVGLGCYVDVYDSIFP